MPIEIRELLIKMKVEESNNSSQLDPYELGKLKKALLKECKREIRDQMKKKSTR